MSRTIYDIAILGGGNIGRAIAIGLAASGKFAANRIAITRRKVELLDDLATQDFQILADNRIAVENSKVILIAVTPQQINDLLDDIKTIIDPKCHFLISVVSGVRIQEIINRIGQDISVVRAMPNTAIAIRESMTCIATTNGQRSQLEMTHEIFSTVGKTLTIDEDLMGAATALCACGVAFFLRAVRAASQGGIEIGFHADEAIVMAAQTARGAASLLLDGQQYHPEREIDKVTTPRGITITGLNEMEHRGFSSAMIKGITTSAEKAQKIYPGQATDD